MKPAKPLKPSFDQRGEVMFGAIFEFSAMGILRTDAEVRILEANQSAATILGFSVEALIGRQLRALVHPDDVSKDSEIRTRLESGRLPSYRVEKRFIRGNGGIAWCNVTLTSMAGSEPGLDELVILLEDITPRKEMEIELNKRAEELALSNKELEQFAFVASHDLSEPLDKIVAFGRLLEDEFTGSMTDEGREYLSYMTKAAGCMHDLIASLLDLSRVTVKGVPFENVDLADTVQQILSEFKLRIEDLGAVVEVDPLPVVHADPVQMGQLFQNLIANGLKFKHPEQPPYIRIESDLFRPQAGSGFDTQGYYCRIMIKDRGIGFEQRHAERVFHPFQRLNPQSAFEGTGIGLAICKKIIDRHGGHIAARSTPGKGTTFAFMLPLAKQE